MLILLTLSFASQLPTAPANNVCQRVHSPFLDNNREKSCEVLKRITSNFGDDRRSFVKGHKHAGADMRTKYRESVYGLCAGKVVDIHLSYPHLTVVVAHQDPDGTTWYASYKHVADVNVKVGDAVDANTKIARVFSKAEQKTAGWRFNHLHFEIRHSIADEGQASWTSMSLRAREKMN